jgi:arylsulfatase A-like enzyme
LGTALFRWMVPGLILLITCSRTGHSAERRPNILLIFSDDHAAHAVGCYGSRINQTPNLDRIAKQGMRFANCLCTNALCGPSRAAVLTGKYSHRNGFFKNGDRFDGRQETMAKLLQGAGYQTAVIGKWHLESDPTGFDYWNILIGQGPYYNPPMIENGMRRKYEGYTTDVLTDLTLNFLKHQRQPDKPFLVMYQHKAPHREWQPDAMHFGLYKDTKVPEPENLFDDYSGRGKAARTQEMTIARHLNDFDLKLTPPKGLSDAQLSPWLAAYKEENEAFQKAGLEGDALIRWRYQRYIKDYLRCIAAIDDNVGRVLDYLDESGLADNTVVIYSSDQGFFLGEHGWFDKRFMYEESLRMPLMIRWPGKTKPGTVNHDLVSNLDFAETLLEVAGVAVPPDMQGRSLVPLLAGKTPGDWRQSHYYHYYEFPAVHSVQRHYGVRTARHKLICFYQLDEWELYDLEKDPREMHNVYDDPQYAGVVRELKAELERLRRQYQVPEDGSP